MIKGVGIAVALITLGIAVWVLAGRGEHDRRSAAVSITPTAAASAGGTQTGYIVIGDGGNWFTPCRSTEKWQLAGDLTAIRDFLRIRPHQAIPPGWGAARFYAALRGTVGPVTEPDPAAQHQHRMTVTEVVEIRRMREGDCVAPAR